MDSTEMDEVGGIIAAFEAQVGEPHRPLALIAHFRVRAGAGPAIEKEFAKASAQTASEAGVLAYQLHREPNNPDVFVVYEHWRSLDDLEAHLRTPYIATLRAEIDAVVEGQPEFQVILPTAT
jgi:quinol monooxygenase YgiN